MSQMKPSRWIILLCVGLFTACGQDSSSPKNPTNADNASLRQTADALVTHAELLLVTPNPFAAMGELNTAIALDPTVARYHFDLGMAHFYAAGYEQAIDSFNTAIDLDAALTLAYYYRGQSAYALQNYDLALESYEQAWDLGTCDSVMVDQMVAIYQQREDATAVQEVQSRTC